MKLHRVTFHNFMPYKGVHVVEFPQDSLANVMLVFGDNMRGKTSFLNGIRWCFYGKAYGRSMDRLIPATDIVNWAAQDEGDWNTSVTLEFESRGRRYQLKRSMTRKEIVSEPKDIHDFDVAVELVRDGDVLAPYLLDHALNEILPEDVSRFFLFDGELLSQYEKLLDDEDEQGEAIKSAIEQILGVPAITKARHELNSLMKDAEREQQKVARKKKGLESQIKQYALEQDRLEKLEKDREKLKENKATTSKKIDELTERLSQTKEIERALERRKQYAEELADLRRQETSIRDDYKSQLKDVWKDVIAARVHVKLEELNARYQTLLKTKSRSDLLKKEIVDLEKLLSGSTCPTCRQTVQIDDKVRVGERMEECRAQLKDCEVSDAEVQRVGADVQDLNTKLQATGAGRELERLQKQLVDNLERQNDREWKEQKLLVELEGFDGGTIGADRQKLIQQEAHRKNLEKEIASQEEQIAISQAKLKELSVMLSRNPELKGNRASRLVEAYAQLEQIFDGAVERLRDRLRLSVEKYATESFRRLTTEPNYRGLRINSSYGLSIVDDSGRVVNQRSAGAEQVVALALIDGLKRTAGQTDAIVMDTPLGRLDLQHRRAILKSLPEIAEQVVLLVHEGEIPRDEVIEGLTDRVGAAYDIERISHNQSTLQKIVE